LCFNFNSSRPIDCQFESFGFLLDRLEDIQSMNIEGFHVERRFILVSPAEFAQLENYRRFLNTSHFLN